eukprot:g38208.t1
MEAALVRDLQRERSAVSRCKSVKVNGCGSTVSAEEVQRLDSCREGGGGCSGSGQVPLPSSAAATLHPQPKPGNRSWNNNSNSNSLLSRRRLRRNLSATSSSGPGRSLDRRKMPGTKLTAADREWVRADVQRGCLHLYDRHMSSYLRPVICTLDTTAAEVAAKLLHPGRTGTGCIPKANGVGMTSLTPLDNAGSARSGTSRSTGARPGRGSLVTSGQTETSNIRSSDIAANKQAQPYLAAHGKPGLSLGTAATVGQHLNIDIVRYEKANTTLARPSLESTKAHNENVNSDTINDTVVKVESVDRSELRSDSLAGEGRLKSSIPDTLGMQVTDGLLTSMVYVQLHGETTRRLEPHENPLEIQNEYLFKLGFKDPSRVQEEGMDVEIGCLIRFYA